MLAGIRSNIRVRSDVFFQHGRFLAPDAAFLADISSPTYKINIPEYSGTGEDGECISCTHLNIFLCERVTI